MSVPIRLREDFKAYPLRGLAKKTKDGPQARRLGLHSFDGEGHEPWTSEGFSMLVKAVRDLDYQIVSVGRMIATHGY